MKARTSDDDGGARGPRGGAGATTEPLREAAAHPGEIVALRELGAGRELPLARLPAVLGTAPDCELVLADPAVSRLHCLLEPRDGAVVARDLGSRNGTFLNGHRIDCGELRPGAVLTLGRTSLLALASTGAGPRTALEQLRGSDRAFRDAIDVALRAAAADCPVLILGETGTGKELVARAVHEASPRASRAFVPINCAAIPRELAASELFGHVAGAFTGAVAPRKGLFAHADGGTVFLDELGELAPELQPSLLRVLETRRVRPVGAADEAPVDLRVVAATHRTGGLGTPDAMIRPDLYHRLAVVVVTLPPLRERMRDLGELVTAIVDELAATFGPRTLTREAWDALRAHAWPGNVRELRQALTRAVALGGPELGARDLFPLPPRDAVGDRRAAPVRAPAPAPRPLAPAPLPTDDAGLRRAMIDALAQARSMREAAARLGMPKSTFAEKALRFGLDLRKARL